MTTASLSAGASPGFCAIDFGTSNSAIALPVAPGQVRLVEVEPAQRTMPTAVFYALEDLAPDQAPERLYGRAALRAYVDGVEGRLMRSMKSVRSEEHTSELQSH